MMKSLWILLSACQLGTAAQTVWNINVGSAIDTGESFEITTTDNYQGASSDNTTNSVWNAASSTSLITLDDSTGDNTAGATFQVTPAGGSAIDFSNQSLTIGDEVFKSWIKDNGNNDPYTVTFGDLSVALGVTYELVVYSGWVFGPDNVPVSQIAGTGLTGTFNLNSLDMEPGNPLATGLAEDTNAANVAGNTNYAHFTNLTADGSGNLSFSFGGPSGVDAPINGFQLVEVVAVPEPSSTALLGLGGLALILRRRK